MNDDRGFPGTKLFIEPSYNFEQYLKEQGNGSNRLRTERTCQPAALEVGDVLTTGESILSEPREGGNGKVLIHLGEGLRGVWLEVPSRIPLSLISVQELAMLKAYEQRKRDCATIRTWPKVDFGGTIPVCNSCGCASVHKDPGDPFHWACGSCGLNTWSVATYFGHYLECLNCHQRIKRDDEIPKECPQCGVKFEKTVLPEGRESK